MAHSAVCSAALTPTHKTIVQQSLRRLPNEIGCPEPKAVIPVMAEISTVINANFINLEALALAVLFDADLAISTDSPLLTNGADLLHLKIHRLYLLTKPVIKTEELWARTATMVSKLRDSSIVSAHRQRLAGHPNSRPSTILRANTRHDRCSQCPSPKFSPPLNQVLHTITEASVTRTCTQQVLRSTPNGPISPR
jgi:hypothetical protein